VTSAAAHWSRFCVGLSELTAKGKKIIRYGVTVRSDPFLRFPVTFGFTARRPRPTCESKPAPFAVLNEILAMRSPLGSHRTRTFNEYPGPIPGVEARSNNSFRNPVERKLLSTHHSPIIAPKLPLPNRSVSTARPYFSRIRPAALEETITAQTKKRSTHRPEQLENNPRSPQ